MEAGGMEAQGKEAQRHKAESDEMMGGCGDEAMLWREAKAKEARRQKA